MGWVQVKPRAGRVPWWWSFLEELLEAGFPEKTAIQMINTTLVMGREEIHYSTVDMTIFDLYSGGM